MPDENQPEAITTTPLSEAVTSTPLPDPIRSTRGVTYGSSIETSATETYDDAGRMRHVGSDPEVHKEVLRARSNAVAEAHKTRRMKLGATVLLFIVACVVGVFGPRDMTTSLITTVLIAAAGGFGYSYLKMKVPGLTLETGSDPKPLPEPDDRSNR